MPQSRRYGDWDNVVPLCPWHHRDAPFSWHRSPKDFCLGSGLHDKSDVAQVAREYTAQFVAETGWGVRAQEGG